MAVPREGIGYKAGGRECDKVGIHGIQDQSRSNALGGALPTTCSLGRESIPIYPY